MINDDRSTDDYQQQRLACVSRIASRVRWIGSSRMDRVESVGSSHRYMLTMMVLERCWLGETVGWNLCGVGWNVCDVGG
jgi:hypothetical protein